MAEEDVFHSSGSDLDNSFDFAGDHGEALEADEAAAQEELAAQEEERRAKAAEEEARRAKAEEDAKYTSPERRRGSTVQPTHTPRNVAFPRLRF